MAFLERAGWYMSNIGYYVIQMLPMMCLSILLFLLITPLRRRRQRREQIISPPKREAALLFFVAFAAGLAAVTVFPTGLWEYVIRLALTPSEWGDGIDFRLFYPYWEDIITETDYRNLYTPFQEIRRGLTTGPWEFFLLLGNIGIFMPIGFFSTLLGCRPRWWKSILWGFSASCIIEFVQFFIGRSTDIDDVILNTLGAFGGYLTFCLFRRLNPAWYGEFVCYKRGDKSEWIM